MDDAKLNNINEYVSVILFTLASILTAGLYVKVGKRLDIAMHVLIAIFLTSFFFRLPFFWNEEDPTNLMFGIASTLVYGIIYFFVFELRRLKDMLESDTKAMLESRKKRTKTIIIVFYSVYVLGNAAVLITVMTINLYYYDAKASVQTLYYALVIIRFIVRIVQDVFMVY